MANQKPKLFIVAGVPGVGTHILATAIAEKSGAQQIRAAGPAANQALFKAFQQVANGTPTVLLANDLTQSDKTGINTDQLHRLMTEAKAAGMEVHLHYVHPQSATLAASRAVSQDGIPPNTNLTTVQAAIANTAREIKTQVAYHTQEIAGLFKNADLATMLTSPTSSNGHHHEVIATAFQGKILVHSQAYAPEMTNKLQMFERANDAALNDAANVVSKLVMRDHNPSQSQIVPQHDKRVMKPNEQTDYRLTGTLQYMNERFYVLEHSKGETGQPRYTIHGIEHLSLAEKQPFPVNGDKIALHYQGLTAAATITPAHEREAEQGRARGGR